MEILVGILCVAVVGLAGWLVYLTRSINKDAHDLDKTREDLETIGIEEIVERQNKKIKKISIDTEELYQITSELSSGISSSITKCGVIRFNPFAGEGGNQSFVVALLNDQNTGVIFTSLYSRTSGSRTYAKEVIEGVSEIVLTEEEKKALQKAK